MYLLLQILSRIYYLYSWWLSFYLEWNGMLMYFELVFSWFPGCWIFFHILCSICSSCFGKCLFSPLTHYALGYLGEFLLFLFCARNWTQSHLVSELHTQPSFIFFWNINSLSYFWNRDSLSCLGISQTAKSVVELKILLVKPPKLLGSQACIISPRDYVFFVSLFVWCLVLFALFDARLLNSLYILNVNPLSRE